MQKILQNSTGKMKWVVYISGVVSKITELEMGWNTARPELCKEKLDTEGKNSSFKKLVLKKLVKEKAQKYGHCQVKGR